MSPIKFQYVLMVCWGQIYKYNLFFLINRTKIHFHGVQLTGITPEYHSINVLVLMVSYYMVCIRCVCGLDNKGLSDS